jgi:hypothetical protein
MHLLIVAPAKNGINLRDYGDIRMWEEMSYSGGTECFL